MRRYAAANFRCSRSQCGGRNSRIPLQLGRLHQRKLPGNRRFRTAAR